MPRLNDSRPLLSIVIPTRNRSTTALSAIRSVLEIRCPELEVVVQDASDTNELEGMIKTEIADVRLRYARDPVSASLVDNFDQAASAATGEYVCFIGDDDGMNPEIIDAVQWAKENDLDALRPSHIAYFFWPDMRAHSNMESFSGKLFVNEFSGELRFPDRDAEMLKCVRNAGQGYLYTDLAKVYHGLVRKDCLDRVHAQTGAYFMGLSPDIFAALAITNTAQRVVAIDYPLTLSGTSVLSAAGDSSAGKHKGRLEDAPHLQNQPDYKWPETVPRFYSVQTIWAESALTTLEVIGREDLLQQFNLPLLYALCLVSHPGFGRIILRDMYRGYRAIGRSYLLGSIQFMSALISSQSVRIGKGLLRRARSQNRSSRHMVGAFGDIGEAVHALGSYLESTNRSFSDCV